MNAKTRNYVKIKNVQNQTAYGFFNVGPEIQGYA